MKIKDILGICFYYWYGSGTHSTPGKLPLSVQGTKLVNADGKVVTTIDATYGFKLHRAFVDNWIIVPELTSTNQSFTIKTNPTEQNFFFDDYFKLMKAQGITNIYCGTGLFDWLKGGAGSQRKSACYDHSMDPSNPAAWKDLAHMYKLLAEYYKDKNLVDYFQILNEYDFRWNVTRIITPEEYAVAFWEVYKAIRSVSLTQGIMTGCTLTPTIETFNRFSTKLDQLAAAEGKPSPRDITYTFNHYVRDSGGNQGGGLADTPESQWNQTYGYYSALNTACKQRGWKWACTETGWSTSTSTSFAALKQKAPALQGVSHEDAQGVLAIRLALMMASFSECVGVNFYHCKDGYEAEPFTYIGFNYDKDFGGKPDWSSKPGKTLIYDFLTKYGELEVDAYTKTDHAAYIAHLSDGTRIAWSDKFDVGAITPMPQEVDTPPTPTKPVVGINIQGDLSKVKLTVQ